MSKVCSVLSNVHFTDSNSFFKVISVGKSEHNNTDSEIYIQICRHNKGFHHPILDSLKSCFRLVKLISFVFNIKRTINTVEPACATIFFK